MGACHRGGTAERPPAALLAQLRVVGHLEHSSRGGGAIASTPHLGGGGTAAPCALGPPVSWEAPLGRLDVGRVTTFVRDAVVPCQHSERGGHISTRRRRRCRSPSYRNKPSHLMPPPCMHHCTCQRRSLTAPPACMNMHLQHAPASPNARLGHVMPLQAAEPALPCRPAGRRRTTYRPLLAGGMA